MIEGQHLDLVAEGGGRLRRWWSGSASPPQDRGALRRRGRDRRRLGSRRRPAGEDFWRLGDLLGLAFQARDDILGIWGDPAITGKPAGGDLLRRKSSLPVAVALEGGDAGLAAAFADRESGVDRLLDLLEAAGARERALEVERLHRGEVEGLLAELIPPGPGGEGLRDLVDALWERTR